MNNDDIKRKTINSSIWTSLESTAVEALSFLAFLVLARLLQPDDYGTMAIAMVFVALFGAVSGFGISGAIIQIRKLDAGHLNSAFWFTLTTGAILYFFIYTLAPHIASFHGESDLESVILWLGLIGIIQSAGIVPQAILNRNFRYSYLAFRAVASTLLSGAIGITMAVYGYGVWALVAQQLSLVVTRNILTWLGAGWTPTFGISWPPLKRLLSVGVYLMGNRLSSTVAGQADNFLVGKFLGARDLGLYSIGFKVFETANFVMLDSLSRVGLPTFSRLQSAPDRLANAYNRAWTVGAALTLPVFILILLTASDLVPLFFGGQWQESASVLQVLMIACCCRSLTNFDSTFLIVCGQARLAFRLSLATTVLQVLGFVVAVKWGITAVASVVAIVAVVMLPVWKIAVQKHSPDSVTIVSPQLVSLGIGLTVLSGTVLVVGHYFAEIAVFLRISSQWALGLTLYGAMVYMMDGALRAGVKDMINMFAGKE